MATWNKVLDGAKQVTGVETLGDFKPATSAAQSFQMSNANLDNITPPSGLPNMGGPRRR